MGFGSYDEDEHEKRAQGTEISDGDYESPEAEYNGEMEFEYGEAEDDEEAINNMLKNLENSK